MSRRERHSWHSQTQCAGEHTHQRRCAQNKACIYKPVSQFDVRVDTQAVSRLDSHYDFNVFSLNVITAGIAVSHCMHPNYVRTNVEI